MKKPFLMGIVNVTPDSFSDGGKFLNSEAAIAHGLKLLEEGAHILDIGGESTRPNAETVTVDEEIARVVPVIKVLSSKAKISIDTRHAKTMQAAIDAGATIINDVTALRGEDSLDVAVKAQLPVCLMHMKGEPQTMQDNPVYQDVVEEVFEFLKSRIDVCVKAGLAKDKIIADVGIGFGKTLEHNLELLKNLDKFQELGVSILLGVSRKSFIEKIMQQPTPTDQRLGGSLAAAIYGVQKGANILRVHDVAATKQALEMWSRLN